MTIAVAELKVKHPWNAFQQYRAVLRRQHTADDEALMRGYRALTRGQRVIDLILTMQTAGQDERGRPRLAIARADAEIVFCRVWSDGAARFSLTQWPRANARGDTVVLLPNGTFGRVSSDCRARVPIVPPQYRPVARLANYFLLWEAEWVNVPTDPILLQRLGKNLYAVMAQWDLTPLEQAIMRGRP